MSIPLIILCLMTFLGSCVNYSELSVKQNTETYLNIGAEITNIENTSTRHSENEKLIFTANNFIDFDLRIDDEIYSLALIGEDDMEGIAIGNSEITDIKIDSNYASIIIRPTSDADINLMYSSQPDFHVTHEVVDGVLNINVKSDIVRNSKQPNTTLKVYIPESLIDQLNIVSNAAFIHIEGKENLFQTCDINASAGAVFLENIYADTKVKTLTGAIKLKNETIHSNIQLNTKIGVIDISLDKLPDDVSVYTRGTVKRNTFSKTRNTASTNEQYVLEAISNLGVINIH